MAHEVVAQQKPAYRGFDLTGRVAVLTGSTAGMGLAMARGLGAAGARLVISSNHSADTEQAETALLQDGYDVRGIPCDITNLGEVRTFATDAEAAFGQVDILVCHAAGPAPIGPIVAVDSEVFDDLMISTVRNNVILINAILPGMAQRGGGSIIVTSSIVWSRASPNLGAYGMAKAAISGLVRTIAAEWGAHNIRANAIAPSVVRTHFARALWQGPNVEAQVASLVPLGRIGEPDDVVGTVILLASPAGAYISGQTIGIDGGRSAV